MCERVELSENCLAPHTFCHKKNRERLKRILRLALGEPVRELRAISPQSSDSGSRYGAVIHVKAASSLSDRDIDTVKRMLQAFYGEGILRYISCDSLNNIGSTMNIHIWGSKLPEKFEEA